MNEIIAKLKETGKAYAFNSQEEFTAAAKSLGYSDEDISAAVGSISFPLSDDELESVAGGRSFSHSTAQPVPLYSLKCRHCGNVIVAGGKRYDADYYPSDLDKVKSEILSLLRSERQKCPNSNGTCEPKESYSRTIQHTSFA